MHRLDRKLGALLILLVQTAAVAATLTGRISDPTSNSYLPNVSVSIPGLGLQTTSGYGGEYVLRNVPPGGQRVVISHLGYEDSTQMVTVAANGETRADFKLGGDVVQLNKLVVEGTREGQARALQQKRSATQIMDVVSADAVGKFPDGNAAEALRRVPGVSVEIDQDEGRYVVVRGIDSALNNVTLNNQAIGTPSEQGNRGVAMDSVPADLIARLEVVKAVTPDMDATAIGGSINIVTQSAFDRPDGFFYGSAGGFYDDFSGKTTPNGSLTFGRILDKAGQWGFVIAGSYSRKEFHSQTSDNINWTEANGFWVPLSQESFDYDIMRERIGANVALQYRPQAGHEFALRFNHNEFTDEEGRQKSGYEYRLGTLTNQSATRGTNSQGRSTREFRSYHQTGSIQAASLSGDHKPGGDYQFEWQVGASRGERDVPKRDDWEYRSAAGAFPNTYDLSGESLIVTPNAAFYDPASYPFRRVRFRKDLEREDVFSAQVDLKRDLRIDTRSGYWKAGGKYVARDKKDNRDNNNFNLNGPAWTLAEPGLAATEPANYFRGRYRYGPTLNLAANEAFFRNNPNRFVRDDAGSLANSLSGDFKVSEDVTAGYAMAGLKWNEQTSIVAGVRVEHTEGDYAANEVRNGVWRPIKRSNSYTNFLPGLHYSWRPTNRTVVRFAWTNTLGRARYSDLAPTRQVDDIETAVGSGVYTGSVTSGNPDLKAFESMNFDLSLEYYLKNAGVISIGAFHKDIDNPVYSNRTTLTNVVVDGRRYNTLVVNQPENAKRGKVTGLELNYQQFFTFLPSPLDGLGVNFNYTIVDSSATLLLQPRKVPFFKQSDEVGNVALMYEKYGFEARVALSFNSAYLSSVGADAATDGYIAKRHPVDAKVSYRVNRNMRVFVELLNLDEQPLREYTGIPSRVSSIEMYYWKARFGVNFNL